MAIYHLHIKTFNRATGANATAAAAYRAGERLRDERSGRTFNFSRRQDVLHKEVVLPARFDGVPMEWARDRAALWSAAELAGKRRDSSLAREFQVTLPHELTHEQRVGLVRGFSQALAERYSVAVDAAIHAPRPNNDPRNFHAHLMTTTREVTEQGLGARMYLSLSPRERAERGLGNVSEEFHAVRGLWAQLTNKALEQANRPERVDHRSLKARGIDRKPRHVKAAVYRAFMQARTEQKQAVLGQATAEPSVAPQPVRPAIAKTLDEIRREAQERWYRMRAQVLGQGASQTAVQTQEQVPSVVQAARRGRNRDFGL